MEWGEAEQSVFCIVVPFLGSSETAHCHKFCIVVLFLGSSNTAHCHKFCTVVLFLGSSNTAHCHTFLYCGPISGKFQYSPLPYIFVLWSYFWEVPIQPTAIHFCIVVLFLGSSNTAHCHTFLYCGPISGKFQYSPLLIQQVVKNRVLQRTLLTNLWAARSLRAWTSNSTAWNSSSLAVGRLAGSFWMHSRRKFCNATAQISTALTTSKPARKESQWVFFTL